MIKHYWVSNPVFTGHIEVKDDIIYNTCAIAYWAKGMNFKAFLDYCNQRYGETKWKQI